MVLPISDIKHRDKKWLHIHKIIFVTHFEPKLKVAQVKVSPQNNILVK